MHTPTFKHAKLVYRGGPKDKPPKIGTLRVKDRWQLLNINRVVSYSKWAIARGLYVEIRLANEGDYRIKTSLVK